MEWREDKSLSQNHVFTFKIFKFYDLYMFITIFMIFMKINDFLNTIGPIRALMAHKGPYGPQPGQGPNPDWTPTRPGQLPMTMHHCLAYLVLTNLSKVNQNLISMLDFTCLDSGKASLGHISVGCALNY